MLFSRSDMAVQSMNRFILKLCSLVMIVSVALSIVSCGKIKGNKHNAEIIAEDSPWFDSEVIKTDFGLAKDKELSTYEAKMAGFDDKYMVILMSGTYFAQGETQEEAFADLSVLDRKTKEVSNLILSDILDETDYVNSASYEDGKLTLQIYKYDPKTYAVSIVDKDIDIKTGKILDRRNHVSSDENYSFNSYEIGEYKINAALKGLDTNPKVVIKWSSSSGDEKQVEIKDDSNILYGVPVILPITDNRILVPIDSERETLFYELDLKEGTISSLDAKDYEWLKLEAIGTTFTGTDGKTYYTEYNGKGISCIDFENKKIDTFLDFNWCNVDLNTLSQLKMIANDGDSVILAGLVEGRFRLTTESAQMGLEYYVVQLTKADKNPHAGKTVLNLYMANEVGYDEVTEAITNFNNVSSDYYIEITDKYSKDNTSMREAKSTEEYRLANLNSDNDMSNQLTMDIISGTGPDIFVNTSDLGVLNNENYLADLSPYFNDLDSSKYFINIIEASKVDGKLYQIPVCFRIEGIGTKSGYVGASGFGFTLDEYKEFVKGPLNGKDVLGTGQAFYFTKLFNNMSDKFINNGKADFTCPEFSVLASYVKENVQDKKISDDTNESSDTLIASHTTCYGTSAYFGELARFNGDYTIAGIPSYDGRGPQFDAWVSVAVSAQSTDVNACAEFVKILLSDDIQNGFAGQEYLVLNRDAFKEIGLIAVDYYNGTGVRRLASQGYSLTENRIVFSLKDIDDLERIIFSCSSMDSEDSAISIILMEEMPAYFLGQKDLDAVINIAQDRVQKVLDERG